RARLLQKLGRGRLGKRRGLAARDREGGENDDGNAPKHRAEHKRRPTSEGPVDGDRAFRCSAFATGLRGLLLVNGLLVYLEDRLVLRRDGERDHARDEPLGPHLVDLVLEVLHVLIREVREAALALQVLV